MKEPQKRKDLTSRKNLNHPVAMGSKDMRDMSATLSVDLLPAIVVRMVNGANVVSDIGGDEDSVMVIFGGSEYLITKENYEIAKTVATKLLTKTIPDRGISFPLKTDDIILLLHLAKDNVSTELRVSPRIGRVLALGSGSPGCDFYRVDQPAAAIASLGDKTPISVETTRIFSLLAGEKYDAIVVSRLSDPEIIMRLQRLQKQGVAIIYETDDLLSEVPKWSEAWHPRLIEENENRQFLMGMADAVFVTTPELKDVLGHSDKTYILPNVIEPARWGPQKCYENPGAHILWAGSATHEEDLKQVVPVLRRLIDKYRKNLRITFMGFCPRDFLQRYRNPGNSNTFWGVDSSIADVVHYIEGVPMTQYAKVLASIGPTIGIAPLLPIPFNEQGKSEIKVVEMIGGMGLPVVASDVPAYRRAIRHQETGLLAKKPLEFETYLSMLIESSDTRQRLGAAGQADILARYSVESVRLQYERAYLDVLSKKGTQRPEANDAIAMRIATLDGGKE